MHALARVAVSAAAIWLASVLLPGLVIEGVTDFWPTVGVLAVVAVVFGLVNMVVKTVTKILTFPLYILTLGLFSLVVNALMLMLTAWLTGYLPWGISVDNFGTAVLGALIISIASLLLTALLAAPRKER